MALKQDEIDRFFKPKIKVLDKIGCVISVIEFVYKWASTDLLTALSSLGALFLIVRGVIGGTFALMKYLSNTTLFEDMTDEKLIEKSKSCKYYFWGLTVTYYIIYYNLIQIVSHSNVSPIKGLMYSILPPAIYSILTIYLKVISPTIARRYAVLQMRTMLLPSIIALISTIVYTVNESGLIWGLISGLFIGSLGVMIVFTLAFFVSTAVAHVLES